MSVDKAKAHYTGKNQSKRLNCAQAIIASYMDKFAMDEKTINVFGSYGGGKAPGGECGALYAAKFMLKDKHPDKIKDCEAAFSSFAGSTKCKEIRTLKKLPCLGCVEKAAEFIDTIK
ncbi:MAG: C-GCAxxG-C-C family protein [Candidatus Omnitrophota bacterium]|jgi:hypothetical protein